MRYQRTAQRMTSAVNCRPLRDPPCFTATVRHRLAMAGFYLAVAAPKSCNRAIEGLTACFTGLEDPRETRRCDHQLIDILAIAVCAVIACAESWEDIELHGRSKRAWLETFLELPNGIPSHDTFRRVFMLLDPDAFEACFATWAPSPRAWG